MISNSIGDQARSFSIGHHNSRLGAKLNKLTKESASGEVADLGLKLGGDASIIHQLENRRVLVEQYARSAQSAATALDWQQQILGDINEVTSDFASKVLTLAQVFDAVAVEEFVDEAKGKFHSAINQLNKEVSGRYIFSELNVDNSPFLSPDRILEKLGSLIENASSAEEAFRNVSDWFDADAEGDGFVSFAYRGTRGGSIKLDVSETDVVEVGVSAVDPEVRELLKGLAIAAVADKASFGDDNVKVGRLLKLGSAEIWQNEPALIQKMARIGAAREQVTASQVRNSTTQAALTVARNDIRQVDLFETSSAILETETQLRNLYILTARIANLSLADYLR